MAAKLTRLTDKRTIQLHLLAESCTICSSRSRQPVRKLLDTPSYVFCVCDYKCMCTCVQVYEYMWCSVHDVIPTRWTIAKQTALQQTACLSSRWLGLVFVMKWVEVFTSTAKETETSTRTQFRDSCYCPKEGNETVWTWLPVSWKDAVCVIYVICMKAGLFYASYRVMQHVKHLYYSIITEIITVCLLVIRYCVLITCLRLIRHENIWFYDLINIRLICILFSLWTEPVFLCMQIGTWPEQGSCIP
jgi:hypothetical protein